jgi:uncharacterized protein YkwD
MTAAVVKLALVAAAVAAAVQASCADPSPTPRSRPGAQAPAAPQGVAPREELQAAAAAVNRNRAGCAPLAWDDVAARAAQAHSDDMARRGYFSHTSPEGGDMGSRLRAQGASYRMAAENIAAGQPTAEMVVQGWLRSSGHRRNIENCGYARHGVGLSAGRWTHVFYTPLQ